MKVIGIKFKDGGKIYYFAPKNNEKYEEGMEVIVETSKSIEFATVAFLPKEVPDSEVVLPLKPVIRIATKKDKEQVKKNLERKPEALKIAEALLENEAERQSMVEAQRREINAYSADDVVKRVVEVVEARNATEKE